jgi:hypothetical protein
MVKGVGSDLVGETVVAGGAEPLGRLLCLAGVEHRQEPATAAEVNSPHRPSPR